MDSVFGYGFMVYDISLIGLSGYSGSVVIVFVITLFTKIFEIML